MRYMIENEGIKAGKIWFTYTLFTSTRCTGLKSRREYPRYDNAVEAAEYMLKKISNKALTREKT
jgi:hypothetical protein